MPLPADGHPRPIPSNGLDRETRLSRLDIVRLPRLSLLFLLI